MNKQDRRWHIVLPAKLHAKLLTLARQQRITVHEVMLVLLEKSTEDVTPSNSLWPEDLPDMVKKAEAIGNRDRLLKLSDMLRQEAARFEEEANGWRKNS